MHMLFKYCFQAALSRVICEHRWIYRWVGSTIQALKRGLIASNTWINPLLRIALSLLLILEYQLPIFHAFLLFCAELFQEKYRVIRSVLIWFFIIRNCRRWLNVQLNWPLSLNIIFLDHQILIILLITLSCRRSSYLLLWHLIMNCNILVSYWRQVVFVQLQIKRRKYVWAPLMRFVLASQPYVRKMQQRSRTTSLVCKSLDTYVFIFDWHFVCIWTFHFLLTCFQNFMLINKSLDLHLNLSLLTLRMYLLPSFAPNILVYNIKVLCLSINLLIELLRKVFWVCPDFLHHQFPNIIVVFRYFLHFTHNSSWLISTVFQIYIGGLLHIHNIQWWLIKIVCLNECVSCLERVLTNWCGWLQVYFRMPNIINRISESRTQVKTTFKLFRSQFQNIELLFTLLILDCAFNIVVTMHPTRILSILRKRGNHESFHAALIWRVVVEYSGTGMLREGRTDHVFKHSFFENSWRLTLLL